MNPTFQDIMNFHNNHIWADVNPHAIIVKRFQQTFSVNVWLGIIEDYLIGPFFLPVRLTGETYLHFLENELPVLLEDFLLLEGACGSCMTELLHIFH